MFSGGRERVPGSKWVNRLLGAIITLKQGTDFRTILSKKICFTIIWKGILINNSSNVKQGKLNFNATSN